MAQQKVVSFVVGSLGDYGSPGKMFAVSAYDRRGDYMSGSAAAKKTFATEEAALAWAIVAFPSAVRLVDVPAPAPAAPDALRFGEDASSARHLFSK